MTTTDPLTANPVLRVAPATPAEAAAHFRAGLAFHADVSDVAATLAADGDPGFVVLDSRSTAAWDQGHIPGAVHLPTALIPEQAEQLLDRSVPVVTYCWGPGCNGATRAALADIETARASSAKLARPSRWRTSRMRQSVASGEYAVMSER